MRGNIQSEGCGVMLCKWAIALWPDNGVGNGHLYCVGAECKALTNRCVYEILQKNFWNNEQKVVVKMWNQYFKFCIKSKNTQHILVHVLKCVFWNTFISYIPLHRVKYLYTVSQENCATTHLFITSTNVGRFSKFFHCCNHLEICNKTHVTLQ